MHLCKKVNEYHEISPLIIKFVTQPRYRYL